VLDICPPNSSAGISIENYPMDMVGAFKQARGIHILVMVDKFTKWIEVKPISKYDGYKTSY
jgi:hypothetical protein